MKVGDVRTFLDVLKTGKLYDVGLEATRAFVQERFGKPDQWGPESSVSSATIWKYGVVELHFQDDRVFLLHCERFEGMPRHQRVPLRPWKLRDNALIEEVERLLEGEGIRFERERMLGDVSVLSLENAVRLYFDPGVKEKLSALSVMKR